MESKLGNAIKQKRPFKSVHDEAFLLIQRTASELNQEVSELLKPYGVTPAKYNVLRILRGARDCGLACGGVAERMVTRDPDVTRLLDGLEAQGLVARSRESEDRRVVTVRISEEGLRLLAKLDAPVEALTVAQLGRVDEVELGVLISILERISKLE
ncbi:MAG: MarR family transcriptional regulator [Anaerolineae bacterium]|nr:MarR family transcriptional regulator [Gemmatimonadaceae bacterium]